MPRRLTAAAAVTAALALAAWAGAGCGGQSAREVLSETASRLDEIRSGRLDAGLVVRGQGEGPRGDLGFTARGPFALARREGALPVARVEYTQIAGPRHAVATLTSTGREAFVTVGGRSYRLPDSRTRPLRGAGGLGGDARELRIEDWLREPRLDDGPRVAGAETDRIRAGLDVARAVNGLLELTEGFGARGAFPSVRGAGADRLQRAARRAEIEILTGAEDRLLRRLSLTVAFGLERGAGVPAGLEGVRIDFRVGVDRPNSPVRVGAPRGARPYAELAGAR